MVTKKRLYLMCVVLGAALLSVCSEANAVAANMNDRCTAFDGFRPTEVGDGTHLDQSVEPNPSIDCSYKSGGAGQPHLLDDVSSESYTTPSRTFSAALHPDGTNPSVHNAERKSREGGLEAALKQTPPGLSTHGTHKIYGSTEESAEDLESAKNVNCSTEIILALFFKSRYCESGTLIVTATSELMSEANIKLADYGSMNWDSKNQIWMIRVRNLETNPGTVLVVDGTECAVETQVLTIPYGCDAKLYPDTADGS